MLKQKGFAIIKNYFGNVSITSGKDGRLEVFSDYNSAAHCLDDSDPIINCKIEEVVILRVEGNKVERQLQGSNP